MKKNFLSLLCLLSMTALFGSEEDVVQLQRAIREGESDRFSQLLYEYDYTREQLNEAERLISEIGLYETDGVVDITRNVLSSAACLVGCVHVYHTVEDFSPVDVTVAARCLAFNEMFNCGIDSFTRSLSHFNRHAQLNDMLRSIRRKKEERIR